jgi:hypothetical protein
MLLPSTPRCEGLLVIGAKRRWLRDAVTGQLIGLYGDGGLVCMLHAPCGR